MPEILALMVSGEVAATVRNAHDSWTVADLKLAIAQQVEHTHTGQMKLHRDGVLLDSGAKLSDVGFRPTDTAPVEVLLTIGLELLKEDLVVELVSPRSKVGSSLLVRHKDGFLKEVRLNARSSSKYDDGYTRASIEEEADADGNPAVFVSATFTEYRDAPAVAGGGGGCMDEKHGVRVSDDGWSLKLVRP